MNLEEAIPEITQIQQKIEELEESKACLGAKLDSRYWKINRGY